MPQVIQYNVMLGEVFEKISDETLVSYYVLDKGFVDDEFLHILSESTVFENLLSRGFFRVGDIALLSKAELIDKTGAPSAEIDRLALYLHQTYGLELGKARLSSWHSYRSKVDYPDFRVPYSVRGSQGDAMRRRIDAFLSAGKTPAYSLA